jgi:hypothetical protein
MSIYAHEIEEAVDKAARKARVDALFAGTKMAASMAATDGDGPQQSDALHGAQVVVLPAGTGRPQQTATTAN